MRIAIKWGVLTFLLFELSNFVLNPNYLGKEHFWVYLFFSFVLFSFGGFVFEYLMKKRTS